MLAGAFIASKTGQASTSFRCAINGLVIRTDHRLDSVDAQTFHHRLDATVASVERGVVIDKEKLTYISNAGLRVMLQPIKKIEEWGGRLALCSVSDDVRAAFETSGFDRLGDPPDTGRSHCRGHRLMHSRTCGRGGRR